jgi:hypothetical protein
VTNWKECKEIIDSVNESWKKILFVINW